MKDNNQGPAEPLVISQFFKNRRRDILRVTIDSYNGRPLVDVRQFYTNPEGLVRPTRKGVAMHIRCLPDLAAAISKAVAKARELGLLDEDETS